MIKFTKMVATGNDFIMIDNRKNLLRNRAEFAKKYCDRHFGIGADGAIFIENVKAQRHKGTKAQSCKALKFTTHNTAFKMRIFNPDGSEAEMCGNGARCAAVFARSQGIVKSKEFDFMTLSGSIRAFAGQDAARIKMPEPKDEQLNIKITIKGKKIFLHHINTGVPHAISINKDIEKINIMEDAPPIRYNSIFPKGANVDFVQIMNPGSLKMRTYERGVEAETLACGTGATASAIISSLLGYTKPPVRVIAKGGILKIHFKKSRLNGGSPKGRPQSTVKDVYLEGEARAVYEGIIK